MTAPIDGDRAHQRNLPQNDAYAPRTGHSEGSAELVAGGSDPVFAARAADVPTDRLLAIEVFGKRLAVCSVGGRYYALEDACPHMGYPLSTGWVCEGAIMCAVHHYRYDPSTGKPLGHCVRRSAKTYPVIEQKGELFVLLRG